MTQPTLSDIFLEYDGTRVVPSLGSLEDTGDSPRIRLDALESRITVGREMSQRDARTIEVTNGDSRVAEFTGDWRTGADERASFVAVSDDDGKTVATVGAAEGGSDRGFRGLVDTRLKESSFDLPAKTVSVGLADWGDGRIEVRTGTTAPTDPPPIELSTRQDDGGRVTVRDAAGAPTGRFDAPEGTVLLTRRGERGGEVVLREYPLLDGQDPVDAKRPEELPRAEPEPTYDNDVQTDVHVHLSGAQDSRFGDAGEPSARIHLDGPRATMVLGRERRHETAEAAAGRLAVRSDTRDSSTDDGEPTPATLLDLQGSGGELTLSNQDDRTVTERGTVRAHDRGLVVEDGGGDPAMLVEDGVIRVQAIAEGDLDEDDLLVDVDPSFTTAEHGVERGGVVEIGIDTGSRDTVGFGVVGPDSPSVYGYNLAAGITADDRRLRLLFDTGATDDDPSTNPVVVDGGGEATVLEEALTTTTAGDPPDSMPDGEYRLLLGDDDLSEIFEEATLRVAG